MHNVKRGFVGLGAAAVVAASLIGAGGAMAAYAARAGMEAYVFMPEDTPVINQKECFLAGAKTFLVNGLITDCGRIVGEGRAARAGQQDQGGQRRDARAGKAAA